jgi:methylated-DNA-[protein]-cysteine S-methyltransferase
MADDLRALIFQIEEATGQPSSEEQSDFAAVRGWIGLVASERGLRMLALPVGERETVLNTLRDYYPDAPIVPDDDTLLAVARQVQAYLRGELREFTVTLDLRGYSAFALAVWAAANRIPYGQTRTYRWIAEQTGGGGAGVYQAVGSALGANPVPLIIPCHRVVGSDGSLTGYAGGVQMKERLLALESGQAAFPGI